MRELKVLRKNQTWELTSLLEGKKAAGCKWVFTIKQSLEGKKKGIRQGWLQGDIVKHMGLIIMKPSLLWQK
jgi:hypothetical protein